MEVRPRCMGCACFDQEPLNVDAYRHPLHTSNTLEPSLVAGCHTYPILYDALMVGCRRTSISDWTSRAPSSSRGMPRYLTVVSDALSHGTSSGISWHSEVSHGIPRNIPPVYADSDLESHPRGPAGFPTMGVSTRSPVRRLTTYPTGRQGSSLTSSQEKSHPAAHHDISQPFRDLPHCWNSTSVTRMLVVLFNGFG